MYTGAIPITPNNDTVFAPPRALYVGSAGALRVFTLDGSDVTFAAVPAGTIIPLRVTKVFATGTVASSIVGLL